MGYMKDRIGEPELLCQMAEELSECAQAALKLARILRDINPTPVTEEDARESLEEEYCDVVNCAIDLGLTPDEKIIKEKQERFVRRWLLKQLQEDADEHT